MEIFDGIKEDIEELLENWKRETEKVKGFSMEKEERFLIVKEQDEKIGYLSFFIRGGLCYLRHAYVLPKFRGKGIGKKLFARAEEIAKEKGCHKIQLKTSEKHRYQIELYKKLGFVVEATYENDMHNITWFMFSKFLR